MTDANKRQSDLDYISSAMCWAGISRRAALRHSGGAA